MMEQVLNLEVRLLVLRHGRRRLIEALASASEESVEALERQITELETRKKASRRTKPAPHDLVAAAFAGSPEAEDRAQSLISKYESRSFLPQLREVERFLEHAGIRHGKLKSRTAALPKVIQALAGMSQSQVAELLEVAAHDRASDFALLANEIMRRDATSVRPPDDAVASSPTTVISKGVNRMSWTKLLTPAWLDVSGAAKQLATSVGDIESRIAAGEFVTRQATPNVTEIKFHKTNGTPKYIVAVPGAADPTPSKP